MIATEYAGLLCGVFAYLLMLVAAIVFLGRGANWMARPPALDFIVAMLSLVPWIVGWAVGARIAHHWVGGIAGLAASIVAQFIALEVFDLIHSRRGKGASLHINSTLIGLFGPWRNRVGLWATVPAVPGFLMVRVIQCVGYYPLVVLLGFKRFRQAEYISISRHKIEKLVGADLIWCLYCDWMTGLWSLGTEMLNQVESFWCPLAFVDKEKCTKCAQFFEMKSWAPSDTDSSEMKQVILTIRGSVARSEDARDLDVR